MNEGVIPPTTPVSITWPTLYPVAGFVGLQACAQANVTVSASVKTVSTTLLKANPARRGVLLFNNSAAQPLYVVYGDVADPKLSLSFALGALNGWQMPYPIYTGPLSAIRLSGDGVVFCTELM